MLYSDLYLKSQNRPPAILFFVALLAVAGFLVSFTRLPTQTTQATKQTVNNHTLVNVSPREVGIFWETNTKTIGWVIWGTSPGSLKSLALDERDFEDNKTPSLYHFVKLKNLSENSSYFYKLVSNNEVITGPDNQPFHFITPGSTTPLESIDPDYGKVVTPSGEAAADALVRLNYPGAYPLMTVAKLDGAWLIPFPYIMTPQDMKNISPDKNTPVILEIYLDDVKKTTIKTTIAQAAPVPKTLTLGTDLDLTSSDNVLSVASSEALVHTANTVSKPEVLFPKDKSIIPGKNPLIKGTASPNTSVSGRINTNPLISFKVNTDPKGNWTVTEPMTISAGEYQLTVTAVDNKNNPVTIRRVFTIAKSGEQVLAAATAPATLTPTQLPTLTPLPLPTNTPFPTEVITTATPTPPVTGVDPIYYLGASAFFIFLGAGMLFLM